MRDTIVRHLHDLAALKKSVAATPQFRDLLLGAIAADIGRGGEDNPPTDPAAILNTMLHRLETDPLWAREYEDFVRGVSYAAPATLISFAEALDAVSRLIAAVIQGKADGAGIGGAA